MNASAERLLASDLLVTSITPYPIRAVELTANALGLPQGGTLNEIYESALKLGLSPCPLEAGPHLRLQLLDQAEGHWGKPVRQQRAPYGSITIASESLTEDDDFPKGFYLRRIEGRLWLRGYRSLHSHVWDNEDHFVFMQK